MDISSRSRGIPSRNVVATRKLVFGMNKILAGYHKRRFLNLISMKKEVCTSTEYEDIMLLNSYGGATNLFAT